jgi:hypothetical protein
MGFAIRWIVLKSWALTKWVGKKTWTVVLLPLADLLRRTWRAVRTGSEDVSGSFEAEAEAEAGTVTDDGEGSWGPKEE